MSNVEPVKMIVIRGAGESRQNAPNFDFSHEKGLNTRWGCFKPHKRGNRRLRLILAAIAAKHKAPNFTVDGQQIMILAAYVEESRA